ncbi:hypothetical protein, partial [Nocardia cyriacigeorgica]|uniref:hypothetical protein n=1 Tax=Nocardia cyriacigeorgica TaxID=135487 RepID=UPI0024581D5B
TYPRPALFCLRNDGRSYYSPAPPTPLLKDEVTMHTFTAVILRVARHPATRTAAACVLACGAEALRVALAGQPVKPQRRFESTGP